jgi:hypothetical protein
MRAFLLLTATILLALPLAAAEGDGYVKASGKPGNAGVFVDGKYLGPATRFTVREKYAVPPGEHEITMRDPRHKDFTTKVTVTAGKTTKIKYKLEPVEPAKPPFGRLRVGPDMPDSFMSVTSGDIGAIYINDRFYGYVDELNNPGGGLLLNPGTYDLRVESKDFGSISQKITIEADKVTVVPLKK